MQFCRSSFGDELLDRNLRSVKVFQPKYRLGHPENYLFLLSGKIFLGSKYPKIIQFNFEKKFTDRNSLLMFSRKQRVVARIFQLHLVEPSGAHYSHNGGQGLHSSGIPRDYIVTIRILSTCLATAWWYTQRLHNSNTYFFYLLGNCLATLRWHFPADNRLVFSVDGLLAIMQIHVHLRTFQTASLKQCEGTYLISSVALAKYQLGHPDQQFCLSQTSVRSP